VTRRHRQGKALIYIRQSTPQQVLSNRESLRLQYALRQRAFGLGWHPDDVEVIDADLGLTATAAQHRPGFQELVARVTLGQVGLILSFDVTRLARNCSLCRCRHKLFYAEGAVMPTGGGSRAGCLVTEEGHALGASA
jgi:DNA invertase Pin-like site-specific DNA recombinase